MEMDAGPSRCIAAQEKTDWVCEVWEMVSPEPGDNWTWGHSREGGLKVDTLVSALNQM